MNSVTSNAVANMNSIKTSFSYSSEQRDVFALLDSVSNGKMSIIEIGGENISNAPDGTSVNDFNYIVFYNDSNWIGVIAYDNRSNAIFRNNKLSGTWGYGKK